MKNKVQIHQFDPVIYPRKLWVSVGATKEILSERFDIQQGYNANFDLDCNYYAICFPVEQKENGLLGILCNFNSKKDISIKNIAHECVHIADYIFDEIGAYSQGFEEKNEQYAYLVGWAADCIEKVKMGKL